jgi:hypothetical protein
VEQAPARGRREISAPGVQYEYPYDGTWEASEASVQSIIVYAGRYSETKRSLHVRGVRDIFRIPGEKSKFPHNADSECLRLCLAVKAVVLWMDIVDRLRLLFQGSTLPVLGTANRSARAGPFFVLTTFLDVGPTPGGIITIQIQRREGNRGGR